MEAVGTLEQALSGSYEIETVLGRGGSATVYLARDVKHARRVALKVLRPELSASLGSGRFVREIQIGARLQHPHILPLYESGEAGGFVYYAMPYVEGENLRQCIGREGPLPLDQAVRIIHDVAEALGYAHEQGVIHRDVKPENILLANGHALVADFGIARALSLAGGERLTSSGVAVGTPAYMSPEQGTGKVDVDARSDVYSLGCVLHEMLAGEPPFTGPTPQAVIARHVSERPPSLRVVRPNVDRAVERVVEVALAKVPADRFASVMEFSDTLTLAASGVYPLALRAPRRSWRLGLAAAAVALVLAAVIGFRAMGGAAPGLDPGQYVVAPFVGGAAAVHGIDPDVLTYEFTAAMRQVPDVAVIDGPRLSDVLLRAGSGPGDFEGWRSAARRVAAGSLVPLSIIARGDSVDLVAELYDTRGGRRTRRASVAIAGGAELAVAARRLAELLFDLPRGAIDFRGTDSPEARRAFIAGKRAMEHWDLERAEAAYLEAAELDPQFAPASFWLAQIRSWQNEPASAWRGHARNAVAARDRLTDARERSRAAALLAMAEGRHPQACAEYEALLAADSLDFQAWFGLGECHGRDEIVVPDAASLSGWRFRGSYHTAAGAYMRALELVPSFMFAFRENAYDRLTRLLYTEPNYFRYGHPEGQDTVPMLASAGIENDTLAFTPFPANLVLGAAAETRPSTRGSAIDENRRRLLLAVRTWAVAFPDSSRPWTTLAQAFEASRQLDGQGDEGALAAARRASRSATTFGDSLVAATVEARALLKLGRFRDAADVARRILTQEDVADSALARHLAGLAALIGQLTESVRYSVVSAPYAASRGRGPSFPIAVHRVREALLAHSAFGVPPDSIAALMRRLDTLLTIHALDESSPAFSCQTEWMPRTLAFPVMRVVTRDPQCWRIVPILEVQWALTAGDTTRVTSVLEALDRLRAARSPGQVATLDTYLEASALLEVADTAGAADRLDRMLAAMPVLRSDLLPEVQQVSGLIRSMVLRARLADAVGDNATASRWAQAVIVLWDDADSELQPLVAAMREITR